ncbi:MAG: heavy-metal-associated domain-containing protein [Treponema lecithinolyticum]|uniref:heavy-metal-associated domain-containing protein n=1 Tax=Treponema lecithinolyticum TaxID=53418 RepID=UPI003FA1E7BD
MEQKIYGAGMMSKEDEQKASQAVSAVAGVSSCTVNFQKAQVWVAYDESNASTEQAIKDAISSCGFDVLG